MYTAVAREAPLTSAGLAGRHGGINPDEDAARCFTASSVKRPCDTCSASPAAWIPWCWASRRSWASSKQAWQASREAGGAGKLTDRLFQRAFSISKEVRSETGINDHPVSVAYIAAVLARQIFGDLSKKTVMMVGAGEMITLCGQHFHQQDVGRC